MVPMIASTDCIKSSDQSECYAWDNNEKYFALKRIGAEADLHLERAKKIIVSYPKCWHEIACICSAESKRQSVSSCPKR
jgi:hypothetical protein